MQIHCSPGIQRPKNPQTDQTHLVTRAFTIQFINTELSIIILRSSMRFSLLLQQYCTWFLVSSLVAQDH